MFIESFCSSSPQFTGFPVKDLSHAFLIRHSPYGLRETKESEATNLHLGFWSLKAFEISSWKFVSDWVKKWIMVTCEHGEVRRKDTAFTNNDVDVAKRVRPKWPRRMVSSTISPGKTNWSWILSQRSL